MFDDPKKELRHLEEELLRSEQKDDDFERFYSEILAEFGDHSNEDLTADSPAAARPRKAQPQAAPRRPQPQSAPRNTYTDNSRYVPAPKKEKGVKGLVILACLETLGIAGVVLWWVMKLL